MNSTLFLTTRALLAVLLPIAGVHAAKLAHIGILDQDHVYLHFLDGEVAHRDDGKGLTAFTSEHENNRDTVKLYGEPLNTTEATKTESWTVTSLQDAAYSGGGSNPTAVYRKSKLNGHAEKEWAGSDFRYESTFEHFVFLKLPTALVPGTSYTLSIAGSTGSDVTSNKFAFDIFNSRSEAIHVNLVGYHSDVSMKSVDLYYWLGDGGGRDYSAMEGNAVYVYNTQTQVSTKVGTVAFWKQSGSDVGWYNLLRTNVWNADISSFTTPGTYRVAIEGVGCSQDFEIRDDIYFEPYRTSVRGYFYMRIGQDSTAGVFPVPRRPLYIPGVSPANTAVYLTTMHPYHPEWKSFSGGDVWDKPDDWKRFRKADNSTNPRATGGHSDALDWDRHLAHVSNIYDLLLPFYLTNGALTEDNLGIAESGNGIPDIIDEARNEVDFFLNLRDGAGYAHGLTNPNQSNELFQAASTGIAAWANAANAAFLAECFRIAGNTPLANTYRDSAIVAYEYAGALVDPMLDSTQNAGESVFRGRDFKMLAATCLYNLTGEQNYEKVIEEQSVATTNQAVLDDYNRGNSRNQVYATAIYVHTQRPVSYPELQSQMRASMLYEARNQEAGLTLQRPSRRATDEQSGYFRTAQNVQRTIIAHSIADSELDRTFWRKALILEADWGLGRNPLNMIQMTTGTTNLAEKRSVQGAYTSGRDDGAPGLHPGHTPYMNLDDWSCGMVMGCPSKLYENSYPGNFKNTWPAAEGYFNTRYVWAHNEFTPRQTMRGKMALYGYLYGIGAKRTGTLAPPGIREQHTRGLPGRGLLESRSLASFLSRNGAVHVLDLRGRTLMRTTSSVSTEGDNQSTVITPFASGVYLYEQQQKSQKYRGRAAGAF